MSITPKQILVGGGAVKRVNGTITGTTPFNIWVPDASSRIQLNGIYLQAWVTTALVGATPFDFVAVCAGSSVTPLWDIGQIATATDAAGPFSCEGV